MALDADFMAELERRGFLGAQSVAQWTAQMLRTAQDPILNPSPDQPGSTDAMGQPGPFREFCTLSCYVV